MAREGILLESGTNEVEILEFVLGGQSFGVNVLKIQAIEQYDPARVTRIQLTHPTVVGTLLFRDECVTLLDLAAEMAEPAPDRADGEHDRPRGDDPDRAADDRLVLVMEFNDLKTAFLVDGVDRIHRVSWAEIQPLSAVLDTPASRFTGSLHIADREILITDLEKIVAGILFQAAATHVAPAAAIVPGATGRAGKVVFLAEDSQLVREAVQTELGAGDYADVRTFANGRDCLAEIRRLSAAAAAKGRPLADHLDVLITDIEMPAMDGLTLCRSIKSDPALQDLPVIIFSSLINEQIARKCEDVRADAYISKPQFRELVDLLDRFTTVPA